MQFVSLEGEGYRKFTTNDIKGELIKDDDAKTLATISTSTSLSSIGLSESESFASSSELDCETLKKKVEGDFDIDSYSSHRNMTATQEKWNAITMLPGPLYCCYYLATRQWLYQEDMDDIIREQQNHGTTNNLHSVDCSNFLMPPLPIIAIVIGVIVHCPFSILYHWKYATTIPPGISRIGHWSRRMDHAGIHLTSALWSYGTSGNRIYFLINILYNFDCMLKQLEPKIRPKRNQNRILISVVLYTLPVLLSDPFLFGRVWMVFAISLWLFATYPLGGWSHAAFHIGIMFVPPMLLQSAHDLQASRPLIDLAAFCSIPR